MRLSASGLRHPDDHQPNRDQHRDEQDLTAAAARRFGLVNGGWARSGAGRGAGCVVVIVAVASTVAASVGTVVSSSVGDDSTAVVAVGLTLGGVSLASIVAVRVGAGV
ncbi:MAG: hypothetical protein UZ13_02678 [Chloroflexi bacterium OLB13]|nr:MAG: hypothetical protein UZ13_02678 [Chloroflexi bacterium OLB13]